MTQLGELVAIGLVNADEVKCPFDHESLEPPKVDNDLIGKGGTLKSRMASGSSTFMYKPFRDQQELPEIPDPRDDPHHVLGNNAKPISMLVAKEQGATPRLWKYALTPAAHHCIPAQESLKDSPILEFMVRKNSRAKVMEGKETRHYTDGQVWANVGYDVNGQENGVYLAANYGVGGGAWDDRDNEDDDDEELPPTPGNADVESDAIEWTGGVASTAEVIIDSAPTSRRLNGANFQIDENSRKWHYVRQAMSLMHAQFHDRHEPYSDHVLGRLYKIYTNYLLLKARNIDGGGCEECRKRDKKMIEELGIPTPFGLVARLNGVSKFLGNYLTGAKWSEQLFTSTWVRNYMRSRR